MGVFGTSAGTEPGVDGYLRGQVFNREVEKRKDEYLCLKFVRTIPSDMGSGEFIGWQVLDPLSPVRAAITPNSFGANPAWRFGYYWPNVGLNSVPNIYPDTDVFINNLYDSLSLQSGIYQPIYSKFVDKRIFQIECYYYKLADLKKLQCSELNFIQLSEITGNYTEGRNYETGNEDLAISQSPHAADKYPSQFTVSFQTVKEIPKAPEISTSKYHTKAKEKQGHAHLTPTCNSYFVTAFTGGDPKPGGGSYYYCQVFHQIRYVNCWNIRLSDLRVKMIPSFPGANSTYLYPQQDFVLKTPSEP